MTLKVICNPISPPLEVLIVAEIIKSENKETIIITWDDKADNKREVSLYQEDGNLLLERTSVINRYLARTIIPELYGGHCPETKSQVDHWISFASFRLNTEPIENDRFEYLDRILLTRTWLVNKRLTLADIHIFCALFLKKDAILDKSYTNVNRWYRHMESLPVVKSALLLVKNNCRTHKEPQKANAANQTQRKTRKQEGKFIDLPEAEMGKVVVRFPPEASGYLHIGHAKAALLNQYYADTFKGQFIMRFDDTNPAKETVEFEEAILQDLKLLQIKPDRFTHTSDYFEVLENYCTQLIENEKAFVDDTPAHLMKEQRDQKLPSENRDNSVEKNLALWKEMRLGSKEGQKYCVRAKIDYQSTNGCMRDPTIYRCKPEPHPRTGNKYKVYPTYDFACPIVDSIENVTHTLRTTEYHDRDAQFLWIIDALGLRHPYIWEYSRLNMTHTVLSKRKLTWFVNEGLVDGWDDPRFPTVRGILRRGMTVEGLKQFIIAQGSSRSVVFMEWDKIWAFNKKVIDPIAIRYTALDDNKLVTVNVVDAKEEWLTVQNHPKDESKGVKRVQVGPKILIEREDAERLVVGENVTFINWGNLMIEKIDKQNGNIVNLEARLNLDDKNYKNTLKVTWLTESLPRSDQNAVESNPIKCFAVYFNHIMNVPVLGKDEDFKNFVSKDTRKEVPMLGEVELKRVKKGEIIQVQRKGFFICDVPYAPASPYSLKEQPVILFHIPDGHTSISRVLPEGDKAQHIKADKKVARGSQESLQKETKNSISAEADRATVSNTIKSSKKESKKKKLPYDVNDDLKALHKISQETQNSSAQQKSKNIEQAKEMMKRILSYMIQEKENRVRQMMNDYKNIAGHDWTPTQNSNNDGCATSISDTGTKTKLKNTIVKTHDGLLQEMGNDIKYEMQMISDCKRDYKMAAGREWKSTDAVNNATTENKNISRKDKITDQIKRQCDKLQNLKKGEAEKDISQEEEKILNSLRNMYKYINENSDEFLAEEISEKIKLQGDKVRHLKSCIPKTDKSIIDQEVKILLSLKNDYKKATGQDWKPAGATSAGSSKQKKENVRKPDKTQETKEVAKNTTGKDSDTNKTGTRLGLEVKKKENFFDWYSQVITKSGMIEYYDVSGCYILRPWSFAIWKIVKDYIDKEITSYGVQECYFPIFVTRSVLEKEKTHIADFAPEVAWVTKCGESDLAEPIAIRPTSETVMYPAYAKWLRSDTELPLKLNQWNNVVRWEFKDPKPFLRTREFLWQEGHTAFATKPEAEAEVMTILDMYARVYEDLLAVPVVKGRKTEKEKFAGGDYTTTVEAFISISGRAIQGATSHHLGQNFSKMFNIQVEGAEGDERSFVYQNSWGLTTRTIGVMIMVHGDDKGLVLPPNVASTQGIVIPCGVTKDMTEEDKQRLQEECHKLVNELTRDSKFRVKGDFRSNRTPGWKFNHWELKGVPVRIELGPKDLERDQVTFVRRDNQQRIIAKRNKVTTSLASLLKDIQADLLSIARKDLNAHIKQVENWNDFCTELNKKNMLLTPFCGEMTCEDNIKTDSAREENNDEPGALSMGAKSLCIPFEQPKLVKPINELRCIHHNCKNRPKFYTLFGRSY